MCNVLFTEPFYSRLEIPSSWNILIEDITAHSSLLSHVYKFRPNIIFTRLGLYFGSDIFATSPFLSLLASPTTGLDHIDLVSAAFYDVQIISIKKQYEILDKVTSTAEHAWALLLMSSRSLLNATSVVRHNKWKRSDLKIHQLSGKTLLIIGYGRLGRILESYARAFRMRCLINDPFIHDEGLSLPLELALPQSDYVILSASYETNDKPIINKLSIKYFKHESIFINISRGELVDEDCLLSLIDLGVCFSIGLDVLCNDSGFSEDLYVTSNLIERSKIDNRVIITPHVGGYAIEAIMATREYVLNQVIAHLNLSIN